MVGQLLKRNRQGQLKISLALLALLMAVMIWQGCGSDSSPTSPEKAASRMVGEWKVSSHKLDGVEYNSNYSQVGDRYILYLDSTGYWYNNLGYPLSDLEWHLQRDSLYLLHHYIFEDVYKYSLSGNKLTLKGFDNSQGKDVEFVLDRQ